MPFDWLTDPTWVGSTIPLWKMAMRMGTACAYGGLVAATYRATVRGKEASETFLPTLVLLSVVIALVTVVINDNLARAFSLVGALAIVRFRTVVEDTRGTAF